VPVAAKDDARQLRGRCNGESTDEERTGRHPRPPVLEPTFLVRLPGRPGKTFRPTRQPKLLVFLHHKQ
jgi:hypothetical protein